MSDCTSDVMTSDDVSYWIVVEGYWKEGTFVDGKEPFKYMAKVDSRLSPDHPSYEEFMNNVHDEDDDIYAFHWFAPDEQIIDDHGDFVITSYNEAY